MRRAGDLQRLQADKAADAMLDMHDEIAGGEAREFGNEILGATGGAPWPHEPIAENVLFADECRPCGLEAAFHSEHRKLNFLATDGSNKLRSVPMWNEKTKINCPAWTFWLSRTRTSVT